MFSARYPDPTLEGMLTGPTALQRIIVAVYVLCLLGASATHLHDIAAAHSLLPYGTLLDAPLPSNLFWSLLLYADLALIVLLLRRPALGTLLTLVLMIADVAHNTLACHTFLHSDVRDFPGLQLQMGFLLFVAITSPFIVRSRYP